MRALDFNPSTPYPDRQAFAGLDAAMHGLDPETAQRLLRDCLDEIALRQQRLRVQERHYAGDAARPSGFFRIG
jgi:hypothetical protein